VANPVLMWGSFLALVLGLLALDFAVFQRKPHPMSTRQAAAWTMVWIGLALAFNLFVWRERGANAGTEFLTGYLIELALSIDNMFVFLVIFRYFALPPIYQHRVLFYGILGAMVMRGVFIAAGTLLLQRFHWLIYVFGAFLVYTAWHLWRDRSRDYNIETNRIVVWGRRHLPLTETYVGQNFVIRRGSRLLVTPLLLVLLTVEFTDLVFAVDSIPAIFGITRDPFIVFTSNIFAIAGLRALYFLLQGMYDKFHYLKEGLALVLAFIGVKMVAGGILESRYQVHIPTSASLAVVALLIGGSILLSLLFPGPPRELEMPVEEPFEKGPPIE
jgi:tellurite resistance protein TerC